MTDVDFLTSDFAMSFNRLKLEDIFTTIFVPINTKIGVLIVNKKSTIWDERITNNSSIIKIEDADKNQIEVFNQSIIESANRFVYSLNGEFPKEIESVEYKEWWNIK